MGEFDAGEFLKYLNSDDFEKQHKSAPKEEDLSLLEMVANDCKRMLEDKLESIQLEWGVWEPDDKLKAEAKRREAILQHDATRPDIKELKFEPIPAEKAEGLKGGFLAMAWNGFVAEIAAGKAEIAEVVILDYMNVKVDEDDAVYYFKVADVDGNVYKGGIKKIKFKTLGMVDYRYTNIKDDDYVAYFRWEWPEDYVERHPGRPEEEYKRYELTFMANGLADKVMTDKRKHAYIIHFNKKGKDLYGLVTQEEYDNLKSIKDDVTFMSVDNCFKAENNRTLDFTW